MSNLEKLNNFIDHLQKDESTTHLLNNAGDEELTRAMKTARELHTHSTDSKADPFFVNALEEELLLMNAEGQEVRVKRSWFWAFVPTLGIAALVVVMGVAVLQPGQDGAVSDRDAISAQEVSDESDERARGVEFTKSRSSAIETVAVEETVAEESTLEPVLEPIMVPIEDTYQQPAFGLGSTSVMESAQP